MTTLSTVSSHSAADPKSKWKSITLNDCRSIRVFWSDNAFQHELTAVTCRNVASVDNRLKGAGSLILEAQNVLATDSQGTEAETDVARRDRLTAITLIPWLYRIFANHSFGEDSLRTTDVFIAQAASAEGLTTELTTNVGFWTIRRGLSIGQR
jgi:hypothetical protein